MFVARQAGSIVKDRSRDKRQFERYGDAQKTNPQFVRVGQRQGQKPGKFVLNSLVSAIQPT